jgi:hypothetical protein
MQQNNDVSSKLEPRKAVHSDTRLIPFRHFKLEPDSGLFLVNGSARFHGQCLAMNYEHQPLLHGALLMYANEIMYGNDPVEARTPFSFKSTLLYFSGPRTVVSFQERNYQD